MIKNFLEEWWDWSQICCRMPIKAKPKISALVSGWKGQVGQLKTACSLQWELKTEQWSVEEEVSCSPLAWQIAGCREGSTAHGRPITHAVESHCIIIDSYVSSDYHAECSLLSSHRMSTNQVIKDPVEGYWEVSLPHWPCKTKRLTFKD